MGQSPSLIARRRRRPQTSGAMPKKGKYAKLSPSRLPFRSRGRRTKIRVRVKKIWRKLKRASLPADDDQSDKMPLRRSRSGRSIASSQQSIRILSNSLVRTLSASQSTGSDLGAVDEEAPLPVSKLDKKIDIVLKEEEAPLPVPELDKNIDIVLVVKGCIQDDLDEALKKLLPQCKELPENWPATKHDPGGPLCLWFKLHPNCKQRIFEFCFPPEDRKISLTSQSFTEAVFPEGYFALPQDILQPVEGLLESCRAWRKDTLAYFFSQYRFHITLNEFTSRLTCPLSHQWAVPYLHLIQLLTIERDYTRLAGSHHRNASQLSWAIANEKVRPMVDAIVDGLLKREHGMEMAQLHLMARKYEGLRPDKDSENNLLKIPYVPSDVEYDLTPISRLVGVPKRCRMSGFTRNFSKSMLRDLFANGDGEINYCAAKDKAWPGPPPSSPRLTNYVISPEKLSSLSLQLDQPSRHEIAWAKNLEEELDRFAKKFSESAVNGDAQVAYKSIEEIGTGEPFDVLAVKSSGTKSDHTSPLAATAKEEPVGGNAAISSTVNSQPGGEIFRTKVAQELIESAEESSKAKSSDTSTTSCAVEEDSPEHNPPSLGESVGAITSQPANENYSAKEIQDELDEWAQEISSDELERKSEGASTTEDVIEINPVNAGMLTSEADHDFEGVKDTEKENTESIGKPLDFEVGQIFQAIVPLHDQDISMKPAEEEVEPSLSEEDQNYTTAPVTPYGVEGFASCSTFENPSHIHHPSSVKSPREGSSTSTQDPSIPRSMSNDKVLLELDNGPNSEHFPDFIPDIPLPPDSQAEQTQTQTSVHQIYSLATDRINRIVGSEKTIAAKLDAMNAEMEQNPAFQHTMQAIKRNSQSQWQPQSQYESSNPPRVRSTTFLHLFTPSNEQPTVDNATTGGTWRSLGPGRKSLFGGMFGGFNGAKTPPA
ncbi:hypothetical protein BDZ45DRAFT_805528 [Acephala macrosclerotiorum]|nr:hypothetical protein BDZ45DRAFT_805528 [Acephala macrosclerotiorum]